MAEARHIPLRLPLLYGGISNQPPHVRHPSQVEDAENFVFQVAHGATKRPGSEFIAAITSLPNALGSGSTAPAADGGAPASCTSGDHATSYTVGYDIIGTDPDGGAISHTSLTTAVGQHTSLCEWSAQGTKRSTLTPNILLILDTVEKLWALCFLMVPDDEQPIALFGNSLNTRNPSADPDVGSYANTGNFGNSATTFLLDIRNITVT
jgi:hypothetical protein